MHGHTYIKYISNTVKKSFFISSMNSKLEGPTFRSLVTCNNQIQLLDYTMKADGSFLHGVLVKITMFQSARPSAFSTQSL